MDFSRAWVSGLNEGHSDVAALSITCVALEAPVMTVEKAVNFPVQLVHFPEKSPVSHDSLPPVLDSVICWIVFVLVTISNHVPTFGDSYFYVFSIT